MAHRITLQSVADHARASQILSTLKERFPGVGLTDIALTVSYTIDAKLSKKEEACVATTLTNPVIEKSSFTKVLGPTTFSQAVEIGFRPGVTDNVGNTVREMVSDVVSRKLKTSEKVYSSLFVFMSGRVSSKDAARMAGELHNSLIEHIRVIPFSAWKGGRVSLVVPKVALTASASAKTINLNIPEAELLRIGKEGIDNGDGTRRGPLALSREELMAIKKYFVGKKRMPTDVELEALAQTWSEHCKHTIFNDPLDEIQDGIYKHYIRGATEKIRKAKGKKDFCVSVFKDNSGAIAFNDDYLITHKVETHNSPSALDPFGGAITGIVGVNRDTLGFGLGAKPIANVYGFCVGDPKDTRVLYRDAKKTEAMLSPRRILEGVVKGVNAGGNQSGIPTPLGFVYTDESYRGKPLVFAGTVGLIPRKHGKRLLHQKRAQAGDYIVMIGGRVGLDGIHGATFSSEALGAGSPATAVQIGDAITQKKFSDVIVRELRDRELYSSITDNGAGGLSCSVAEMAQECGGCEVDLATVPLKYPGLAPWQIWISESQERMTLSVPKKKWSELKRILDTHGVEGTRIGTFTASGSCVVTYGKKPMMNVELSFLHDGRPKHEQKSTKPKATPKGSPLPKVDVADSILKLLARPNIGSIEFISSQYDHEVQGRSVTKPLVGKGRVNADAGVIKPLPDDAKGVVLSHGYAPSYSESDPYRMAAAAIDTAVRNAVAAGGSLSHLAILDNFCWSSSKDSERLWQLKEAARACYETAVAYGTPYISGKDSMFNDFRGYDAKGNTTHIKALPTLLVSAIGVMKDARTAMTFDFKSDGDRIYLIGDTREEFGGSEYAQMLGSTDGVVPRVDVQEHLRAYRLLESTMRKRFVSAAFGLSRGGLAAALSKMAIAGKMGAQVSLPTSKTLTTQLFSESQGRLLVTVPERKAKEFEKAMKGVTCRKLGVVTKEPTLVIKGTGKAVRLPVSALHRAYQKPFKQFTV